MAAANATAIPAMQDRMAANANARTGRRHNVKRSKTAALILTSACVKNPACRKKPGSRANHASPGHRAQQQVKCKLPPLKKPAFQRRPSTSFGRIQSYAA